MVNIPNIIFSVISFRYPPPPRAVYSLVQLSFQFQSQIYRPQSSFGLVAPSSVHSSAHEKIYNPPGLSSISIRVQ